MAQKPPSDGSSETGIKRPTIDGDERRRRNEKLATRTDVDRDAKGNPVLKIRVESPRRRKDDDTVNLLKILDVDALSLEDAENDSNLGGFNPYDRKK